MIDTLKDLWVLAKPYLTGMVTRWLLKVGGSVLAYSGWDENQTLVFVGGLLSIIAGMLISLFQNKKAVLATPPAP